MSRSILSACFFVSFMGILPKSITKLTFCDISIQDSCENILILPPNIETILLFECHFNSINDMVAQSISKLNELIVFHDGRSHIFDSPAYQPNPKLKHLAVYSDNIIPVEKTTFPYTLGTLTLGDYNLFDASQKIFDLCFSSDSNLEGVFLKGSRLNKALFTDLLIELLKQEQDIIIIKYKEESCCKKQLLLPFPSKGKTIELCSSYGCSEEFEHCSSSTGIVDSEELQQAKIRNSLLQAPLKMANEDHETRFRGIIRLIDFNALSIYIKPYVK